MEVSRKLCRLCLSETDFNISLRSSYCRKSNMVDKILVCLKIVIEETDSLNTICYRCANNVERYYDFITFIKKSQARMNSDCDRQRSFDSMNLNRRVTSYVREQVFDADYTFSFLDLPEDKKEVASSPFFSYFSPPQKQANEPLWKTPRPTQEPKKEEYKMPRKATSRQHSRDLFESQSQEAEEPDSKTLDWKLTPDEDDGEGKQKNPVSRATCRPGAIKTKDVCHSPTCTPLQKEARVPTVETLKADDKYGQLNMWFG